MGYFRFQSTPPRRGRLTTGAGANARNVFQSTPPRRGRPAPLMELQHGLDCFNPRPREGGDSEDPHALSDNNTVSIHAPAKGATREIWQFDRLYGQFQSTPPRRGRR